MIHHVVFELEDSLSIEAFDDGLQSARQALEDVGIKTRRIRVLADNELPVLPLTPYRLTAEAASARKGDRT